MTESQIIKNEILLYFRGEKFHKNQTAIPWNVWVTLIIVFHVRGCPICYINIYLFLLFEVIGFRFPVLYISYVCLKTIIQRWIFLEKMTFEIPTLPSMFWRPAPQLPFPTGGNNWAIYSLGLLSLVPVYDSLLFLSNTSNILNANNISNSYIHLWL